MKTSKKILALLLALTVIFASIPMSFGISATAYEHTVAPGTERNEYTNVALLVHRVLKNYASADDVTVYVSNNGTGNVNTPHFYGWRSGNPANDKGHKCLVTYTAAAGETKPTLYSSLPSDNAHIGIYGDSIFENVRLYITHLDKGIQSAGWDLTIKSSVEMTNNGNSGYEKVYVGTNSNSCVEVGTEGATVTLDGFNLTGQYAGAIFGGASGTETVKGTQTLISKNNRVNLIFAGSNTTTYENDINIFLENAVVNDVSVSYKGKNVDPGTTIVNGAIQILATGNSVFDKDALYSAATNSKNTVKGGVYILDCSNQTEGSLELTDTAGTYKVNAPEGYAAIAESETATYGSVDGFLTVPAGVYEITYRKAATVEFTVAPGTGKDEASCVAKLVHNTIEPNYTTSDDVTVYVSNQGEGEDNTPCYYEWRGETAPAHTTTVKYKTKQGEEKATLYSGNDAKLTLYGDSVFSNINLEIQNKDYGIETAGHSLTLDSTVGITNTGYAAHKKIFIGSMSNAGTEVSKIDGTVKVDGINFDGTDEGVIAGAIIFGTYKNALSVSGNQTLISNNNSIRLAFAGSGAATFEKNINVVLNNATIEAMAKWGENGTTTVNGAIQVIANGTSTIDKDNVYAVASNSAITAKGGIYVLDSSNQNGSLEPTETAGVFTVKGGLDAVATDGLNTYRSVKGVLTVPAGNYSVTYKKLSYIIGPVESDEYDHTNVAKLVHNTIQPNHVEDDKITVYVSNKDKGDLKKPDFFGWRGEDVPAYEGEVTFTTNPGEERATLYDGGANITLYGDTVFTNLILRVTDINHGVMTAGYNFTIDDTVTTYNQGNIGWCKLFVGAAKNAGTAMSPDDATITVNGYDFQEGIVLGSYDGDFTVPGNQTIILNNNSTTLKFAGGGNMTYNKNVDILVENTEIRKSYNQWTGHKYTPSGTTTIKGALQIIVNGSSSIDGALAYEKATESNITVEDGVFVLDSSNQGGRLELTNTVGKYKVISDNIAIATDAEGKMYYSYQGYLTVPAGQYTVNYDAPPEIYVSDAGSDDNTGIAPDKAFKTFAKAFTFAGNAKTFVINVADTATLDLTGIESQSALLTIKGVDETSILKIADDVHFVGDTIFKNIKVENTGKAIYTEGKRFEIDNATFTEAPVIYTGSATDDYEKLNLNSVDISKVVAGSSKDTHIVIDGAEVSEVEVAANNAASDIKIQVESGIANSFAINNAAIYNSLQVIANNGTSYGSPVIGANNWYIKSANVAGARVDFTDTPGTFNITAPAGKTPVAVAQDGTEYFASEYSASDVEPATYYTRDEFAEFINYRKPLANTYKKLTEDKELNVVYFGGSVTNGLGASIKDELCWRGLISKWLIENFDDANINNINLALAESGSYIGTYRVQRDVISKKPDLLFIEYAINDSYYRSGYENAAIQYETIVREVKQALPDCDIVTILVTDSSFAEAARLGSLHPEARAHEAMAQIYNIPSIHVGRALCSTLPEGWTIEKDWVGKVMTDTVHPTDAGYKIYYDCIEEYMYNSLFDTDYTGYVQRVEELPPVQNKNLMDGNRQIINITEDHLTQSEALGGSGFTFSSDLYGVYDYYGYAYTNSSDAVFAYTFDGTETAILTRWSTGKDKLLVSVDGGEYETLNVGHQNPIMLASGLKSGTHTIRVKAVFTDTSPEEFNIGAICTRDTTKDTPQGTVYEYTHSYNYTITLPAGTYEIKYRGEGEDSLIEEGLTTAGAEVRTVSEDGLRFIAKISKDVLATLEGFDAANVDNKNFTAELGYGFVALPTNMLDGELTKETANAAIAPAINIFEVTDEYVAFTVCITGIKNLDREYTVRSYITYKDASGETKTVYGESMAASFNSANA